MTTIIEPSANSNVFDKVTKFIDENIRVFRVSALSHVISRDAFNYSMLHGSLVVQECYYY